MDTTTTPVVPELVSTSTTPVPQEPDMTKTTRYTNPVTGKTVTTHRCTTCSKRFEGTGKRGRPNKRCPDCRAKRAAAGK